MSSFELERFEVLDVMDGTALVRVEGRWAEEPPADDPKLLVASTRDMDMITPLPTAGRGPAGTLRWRAGYAVRSTFIFDSGATFALATGEAAPVSLPAPAVSDPPPAAGAPLWARLRLAAIESWAVVSTGLGIAGAQIMLAIAGIIAARALGPSGRGVATAITTWVFVLSAVSLAGVNTAASVRVAADDDPNGGPHLRAVLGNALGYALVVGGVLAAIAAVALPPVVDHLGHDAGTIVALAMLILPLALLIEILLSVQIALGRRRTFVTARWAHAGGVLLLTCLLVATGNVTPGWIVAITLGCSVLSISVAGHNLPWRTLTFNVAVLVQDVRFGMRMAMTGWLSMANARLDYVLMSAFVPAAQIGYYGVANNVMLPVATLASAAAALATPAVARLGRGSAEKRGTREQLDYIAGEGRRTLVLSSLGGVLLAAAAPFIVPLLLGHAFTPAIVLIWVLIPGYVVRAAGVVLSAGAAGLRMARVGIVAEGTAVIVTLALLPILLPRYNALGAAITSTCAYAVSGAAAYWSYRRLRDGGAPRVSHPAVEEPQFVERQTSMSGVGN